MEILITALVSALVSVVVSVLVINAAIFHAWKRLEAETFKYIEEQAKAWGDVVMSVAEELRKTHSTK